MYIYFPALIANKEIHIKTRIQVYSEKATKTLVCNYSLSLFFKRNIQCLFSIIGQ